VVVVEVEAFQHPTARHVLGDPCGASRANAAATQAQRGELIALPLDTDDAEGRLLGEAVEAHLQGGQHLVDAKGIGDRDGALVADEVAVEVEGFQHPVAA